MTTTNECRSRWLRAPATNTSPPNRRLRSAGFHFSDGWSVRSNWKRTRVTRAAGALTGGGRTSRPGWTAPCPHVCPCELSRSFVSAASSFSCGRAVAVTLVSCSARALSVRLESAGPIMPCRRPSNREFPIRWNREGFHLIRNRSNRRLPAKGRSFAPCRQPSGRHRLR
jgi:hypothetical protein